MEENNPYAAPRTELLDKGNEPPEMELADRWVRLLGSFIDGVLNLIALAPVMWFGGYIEALMSNQVGFGQVLLWTAIAFVVFVLLQGFPLFYWGQTWAKRLLDIRIVDMDGHQPEFWKLIVLRYGVPQVFAVIPIVNVVFGLANPLFIFGEQRRCLHDLVAGTRVINIHKR